MREILFRGKRDDNLKWIYGYIYRITENQEMPFLMMKDYHGITYPVYPDTIGQYTGFTDKNGRKAFEGDCINHHFGPEIGIIRYGQYQNTFNDDQFAAHIGFYVEWKGPQANSLRKDLGFWLSLNGVSIIGNIHDNPELMEDEYHG